MSAVAEPQARLRHYLEQMMLVFVLSELDPAEASEHLAEIESHCIEAGGDEPADPFELFGDPTDLALSMVPAPSLGEYLRHATWMVIVSLAGLAVVALLVGLGVDSVSRRTALFPVVVIALSTILSLSFVRPIGDAVRVNRGPIVASVGVIAVGAALVSAVVWFGFPDDVVPLRWGVWFGVLGVVVLVAGLLFRAQLVDARATRSGVVAPQPIGVTADIVEDMQTKRIREGWLRYDMDGEVLAEMSFRETVRWVYGKAKSAYRRIRELLDEQPPRRNA